MAKPATFEHLVMPKGGAGGQSPAEALRKEDTRVAAVQTVQQIATQSAQDVAPTTQQFDPRPETVTFVLQPSTRVATSNVQVRLPVHIARNLRILSANLDVSQQELMGKWITDGVEQLWRQSQGGNQSH